MYPNQNRYRRRGLCIFPGYNWCGPGCSGPGKPINDVDACCRAHDHCLKQHSTCYCDQQFMNCLRPKINPHTRKGRHARLMYNYMKVQSGFTCMRKY